MTEYMTFTKWPQGTRIILVTPSYTFPLVSLELAIYVCLLSPADSEYLLGRDNLFYSTQHSALDVVYPQCKSADLI